MSASGLGRATPEISAARVLALVQALLHELRGADAPPPELDDDLERTLGIDSLARMELMLRLEQAFDVRLPETAMRVAQTPRDLLRAMAAAPRRDGAPAPSAAVPLPAPAEGAVAAPRQARTLIDVIDWHAERAAARRHVLLLSEAESPPQVLDHASLRQHARQLAGALQQHGLAPGETVALMLPTGLAFLECFLAVLLAGGVPVPIYPPFRAEQIEDHLRRQARILANAQAALLVSDASALSAARLLRAGLPGLRGVVTVERLRASGARWQRVARGALDTALIQYTSGSTGQPKGVVLTHANLLANIRAMGQVLKAGPQDSFVSWLPLYHDMGLIGAWLGSLYHGMPLVLMSPRAFLGRPSRWLREISEHRATLSAAPNFAYEILAAKVPDDELRGLDLSCWRVAMNGSEPVHAATLARFAERFGRHGFDRRAMLPVYGLAESAVGLAFPPLGRAPRIDAIDRRALHESRRAVPTPEGAAGAAMQVVCCGSALPGHELRVVDQQGTELPDRHEGRIEFRGPSATAGYFRNPQGTRALFRGDWLDTGDVGYVADGEVYLTSRAKDLIIRGGHNVHPYDLEDAVGALPGVRRGCVAVFGAADPASRSERIVVLAETRLTEPAAKAALRERIAGLALQVLGLAADEIVLAPPRAVLKTSSGKIRRAACRELYEQGRIGRPASGVGWQLLRLWGDAWRSRLREPARRLGAALFGAWLWALFALGALLGAAAALLPGLARRKRIGRAIARAGLWLSGLALRVDGQAASGDAAAIFVCNHASYIDWLVLTAVLPARARFVAKRELARWTPLRWLLVRMGVRFVERGLVQGSTADAQGLVEAVQAGESLVYFPEGTLSRAPGLQPFHLGAFVAAVQTGAALVPVSLRGTRSVLRDGSWWPRREAIAVCVHEPLHAEGAAWLDAVHLRDRARERVGQGCGEPMLAG